MKEETRSKPVKKTIKKLKRQDKELDEIGAVKSIDKSLSEEERFLKKILKKFKRL